MNKFKSNIIDGTFYTFLNESQFEEVVFLVNNLDPRFSLKEELLKTTLAMIHVSCLNLINLERNDVIEIDDSIIKMSAQHWLCKICDTTDTLPGYSAESVLLAGLTIDVRTKEEFKGYYSNITTIKRLLERNRMYLNFRKAMATDLIKPTISELLEFNLLMMLSTAKYTKTFVKARRLI